MFVYVERTKRSKGRRRRHWATVEARLSGPIIVTARSNNRKFG